MANVLISIRPKWVDLIAKGRKTVEIRKTRPKLSTPFKCYIYCTKGKNQSSDLCVIENKPYEEYLGNGHVIGEFICNEINLVSYDDFEAHYFDMVLIEATDKEFAKGCCISCDELFDYVTDDFYAWHISDLVIYDEPKELSEFSKWDDYRPCENKVFKCKYESFDEQENCNCCGIDFDGTNCPYIKVQRPPQSWCYIE